MSKATGWQAHPSTHQIAHWTRPGTTQSMRAYCQNISLKTTSATVALSNGLVAGPRLRPRATST
eukprot:12910402-Prorocentrum_lima.AAC.1